MAALSKEEFTDVVKSIRNKCSQILLYCYFPKLKNVTTTVIFLSVKTVNNGF